MKKLIAGGIALMTLIAAPVYAADLKVGIIDSNQILQKSPLMIQLNSDLMKKFQPRQAALNEAQKQLQADSNSLNVNGAAMTSSERSALQTKIINEQADVQIQSANLQKDLAIAKDEALKTFSTKLNSAIAKVARDGGYDLIEQSSNFAFVNPRFDITQKVLENL